MVTRGRTRRPPPGKTPYLDGPLWKRIRRWVIDVRDGGRCHACGHWGADGADHDPCPLSECEARGVSPMDTANLKAIHHSKPCTECVQAAAALGNTWSGYCNAIKGSGSLERFRLKLAEACGTAPGTPAPPGKSLLRQPRQPPARAATAAGPGEREW